MNVTTYLNPLFAPSDETYELIERHSAHIVQCASTLDKALKTKTFSEATLASLLSHLSSQLSNETCLAEKTIHRISPENLACLANQVLAHYQLQILDSKVFLANLFRRV